MRFNHKSTLRSSIRLYQLLLAFILVLSTALTITADEKALVKVSYASKVGILLDDVPDKIKDEIVQKYSSIGSSFWIERAKRHYKFTWYYNQWRMYFQDGKHQMVHTPEDTWKITLVDSKPTLETLETGSNSHIYLTMNYQFQTYILTNEDSLVQSEPALSQEGSSWTDKLLLPIDPDHIFQRTGYSCMDESEFPAGSVNSGNAWSFYDWYCDVESSKFDPSNMYRCHITKSPETSCVEELNIRVGSILVEYTFERVAWDDTIASEYRRGTPAADTEGSNLKSVASTASSNGRIVYKYFPADSCAIKKKCIQEKGWRRVMQIDTKSINVGNSALFIGSVANPSTSSMIKNNVFQLNTCDNHYHMPYFASYSVAIAGQSFSGDRESWCLESTFREYNHENVPINTPYWKCSYQGIEQGWSDSDASAGVDCQWIDLTDYNSAGQASLKLQLNPEGFLCEGKPMLENDDYTYEPTDKKAPDGSAVQKPKCTFRTNYDSDNVLQAVYEVPRTGSVITQSCPYEQIGPMRDCGLELHSTLKCTPNKVYVLKAQVEGAAAQVVRICEYSQKLKSPIACEYAESMLSQPVPDSNAVEYQFLCPTARDDEEVGGMVSIYYGPYTSSGQKNKIKVSGREAGKNAAPSSLTSNYILSIAAILVINWFIVSVITQK